MIKLTEVQIPERGLMLLFVPTSSDSYRAEMLYAPPENNDLEEIKFYVALGQGLMALAHNNTQEVVDIGIDAVNQVHGVDINNDPDNVIETIMDDDNKTVH